MVCIPDPRERAQDRDDNREVCEYTHDQHRAVIVSVVNKDQNHPEYQPHEARGGASRVDSPEVL